MLAHSDKGLAATAIASPARPGKTPVLTDARRGYSPLRGNKDVGEVIEGTSLRTSAKRQGDDHALLSLLDPRGFKGLHVVLIWAPLRSDGTKTLSLLIKSRIGKWAVA